MPHSYYYLAVSISLIALLIAIGTYRRKSGIFLRGSFSVGSSTSCEDKYITHIILENMKDRAVTIFDIYLKVGYSIYIHLESFEDAPLILKPFESLRKSYGPIEFYGFNMRRVGINELFDNRRVRKRLVLSTSDGKYRVDRHIKRWNPVAEFFDNHSTAILRPIPSVFGETHLGGNVSFVLEVFHENGKAETIPLRKSDHRLKIFRNFNLTEESLSNKESLELYLLEQQIAGTLKCRDFKVHDLANWRVELDRDYNKAVAITRDSFFRYHVLGRIYTLWSRFKLRWKNWRARRRHIN